MVTEQSVKAVFCEACRFLSVAVCWRHYLLSLLRKMAMEAWERERHLFLAWQFAFSNQEWVLGDIDMFNTLFNKLIVSFFFNKLIVFAANEWWIVVTESEGNTNGLLCGENSVEQGEWQVVTTSFLRHFNCSSCCVYCMYLGVEVTNYERNWRYLSFILRNLPGLEAANVGYLFAWTGLCLFLHVVMVAVSLPTL